ncbi:factor-independent urate hydroxylase [Pseudonocardia sp. KRD291]|uniref:factor-independent urate hydroxylase n=1 Tax=Pseudonocardia sp. KRD291 TaxID=2792007 RepID=UPI001C4A253F|nr:urate oxidase [Pseudonocardia sp. KRD291]MBW0102859.1 urate oxidase [Pseudonocardia sp. KRD291]
MGIVLGANQYGKAENRLVRIHRATERHDIRDVTVSTALRGDFTDAHSRGDQSQVLPTDTQKNTCYAFAREHGLDQIEDFALALARHFVGDVEPVTGATVAIDELGWERAAVGEGGHDHTWVRTGPEVRTAEVTIDGDDEHVVSGLKGLVLLKSTGSEFHGFLTDPYTTLEPTNDRIMSTSLEARWEHAGTTGEWARTHLSVRQILVERFATVHSLALQQTLWEMGRAVLETHPDVTAVSLSAPNKHHFLVDLEPFGLDNPGEVFFAADRPYGLIEATVTRD